MPLITAVEPGSPAARAGLAPGEALLSAGGHPIRDVLDYRFYTYEPRLTLTVRDARGTERTVLLRHREGEELGLTFETYLMDSQQACENQCLFCFIDQLPPGLRRSLYFKDDDARLSFLLGQYITLTNLTPDDFDRILAQRISPLHISVHATDPALRVRLLGHPAAGDCLSRRKILAARGIRMQAQVVVCPGLNDGAALARTLSDLAALFPAVSDVSVVPVGLTRWREGLYPLRPFTEKEAAQTVALVRGMAGALRAETGLGVLYAADELYLLAGLPAPGEDEYDGYPQLENGVGLMTSFEAEFDAALRALPSSAPTPPPFTVATGLAAAPFLRTLLAKLSRRLPETVWAVEAAPNRLFGETVDVAGLLCGADLAAALEGHVTGGRVLIPACMLRHGGDVFLDDLTPDDLARRIGASVTVVPVDGGAFLAAVRGA
jgi:putative radical SAM enzyme (TIGR03279 family)